MANNEEVKKSFEEAKEMLEEIIANAQMMLDGCNGILSKDADGYLPCDNDNLKRIVNLFNDM